MNTEPEPLAAVLAYFRKFALRAAGEGRTISPESVLLLADKVEAAEAQERVSLQGTIDKMRRAISENTPGNAAALRAALASLLRWVDDHCQIGAFDEGSTKEDIRREWDALNAAKDSARAALAEPARNCDVGTAQEQIDRFHEFCHSNRYYVDEFHGYDCRPDCPIGKIVDRDNKFCDNCWAAWAQMPFVPAKGGAE